MASEHTNTNEAIAQAVAEATRAAIQGMAVAEAQTRQTDDETTHIQQEAEDYNELKNFRLNVNKIFKSYSMPQEGQIAILKNWLGRKSLKFL